MRKHGSMKYEGGGHIRGKTVCNRFMQNFYRERYPKEIVKMTSTPIYSHYTL